MRYWTMILVLGILAFPRPAAAGDPGTTVADFLNIGIGARASGMGDAFVGIADDASAIYWNPGGLSQLKRPEAMGMYTVWLADTSYQFVGCAQPSSYGTFAGSISYFAFGNIPGYDPKGIPIGNVTAYDLSLLGSWSKQVRDGLSLGTNIKYIQETLADTNASALAIDMGLLAKTINPKISFGASVQNIGTRMRFINQEGDLPLNIRLGLSYRATESFTAALDFVMPRSDKNTLNLGFEYWFQQVALRAGYRSYSALGTNFSVGVALKTPSFQVDYAYVPYGDIGNTHRLSLTLRFGLSEEEIYSQMLKHYNLGDLYFKSGKYDEAINEFQQVLAIQPGHKDALRQIRTIEDTRRKEYMEQQQLEIKGMITAHFNLAENYYKEKDYSDAMSEYLEVLTIDSGNVMARSSLVKTLQQMRKVESSKVKAAVRDYMSQAGECLITDRYPQALQEVRKALVVDPRDPEANKLLEKLQVIIRLQKVK